MDMNRNPYAIRGASAVGKGLACYTTAPASKLSLDTFTLIQTNQNETNKIRLKNPDFFFIICISINFFQAFSYPWASELLASLLLGLSGLRIKGLSHTHSPGPQRPKWSISLLPEQQAQPAGEASHCAGTWQDVTQHPALKVWGSQQCWLQAWPLTSPPKTTVTQISWRNEQTAPASIWT